MPKYVSEMAVKRLNKVGKTITGSRTLIMGQTYKEDVVDIRKSPVEKMVHEIKEYDVDVYPDFATKKRRWSLANKTRILKND